MKFTLCSSANTGSGPIEKMPRFALLVVPQRSKRRRLAVICCLVGLCSCGLCFDAPPQVLPSASTRAPLAAALAATSEVAAALLLGAAATLLGLLPQASLEALSKAVVNVLLPLFLGSSIAKSVSTSISSGSLHVVWIMPSVALVNIASSAVLAILLCQCLGILVSEADGKLVVLLSSFGNSALPLVFASAIFRTSPDILASIVGGVSLYILGWSITFWSVAHAIAEAAAEQDSDGIDELGGTMPRRLDRQRSQSTVFCREALHRILGVPPVRGVLCGLLLGLLRPLRLLALPSPGAAVDTLWPHPPLVPFMRAAESLGAAAIPVSQVVLAGSLAMSMSSAGKGSGQSSASMRLASWRSIAVVASVRLVLLPLLALSLLWGTGAGGSLATDLTGANKALLFVALAEASVPSCQNMAVIMQALGRPDLASGIARISVGVYLMAMPFLCFWCTIWLSYTDL